MSHICMTATMSSLEEQWNPFQTILILRIRQCFTLQAYCLPSKYAYDHGRYSEKEYLRKFAIDANYIMKQIEKKRCRLSIFVFDCCRVKIKGRNLNTSGHFASMGRAPGSLIVYACAPGAKVIETTPNERNSYLMFNLLKYIHRPDLHVEDIFRQVAKDVQKQSGNNQIVCRQSSINETIFLSDQGRDVLVAQNHTVNNQ
jgi:hypothetical protein